jgi:hypothetical protein
MKDQRTDRVESEDIARLDQLLESLQQVKVPGPSPAVRSRLSQLYAERLRETPIPTKKPGGRLLKPSFWFRTAAASGALIAVVVMAMFLFHRHQRGHLRADHNSRVTSPEVTLASGGRTEVKAPTLKVALLPVRRSRSSHAKSAAPQNQKMTVPLPYSNSAIATGTSTTIRVSMSQFELASLGFPVGEIPRDRRVVAELTLGDDGLPRAISLPLPLEVIKEKR